MSVNSFKYNDGGRKNSGYKGETNDCVTRAIAIATGKPYKEIYDAINTLGTDERISKKIRGKSTARTGVYKSTYKQYLKRLGWKWTPTMFIGQGCKTHLRSEELPKGVIIVSLSKHLSAIIDGIVQDTFDPSRGGTRCVYGYFSK